ncbi:hypothetical protein [Spirillospora sp. NPDC048819]|uniref:hypothetical protein n=1 Tax=Spirillospora sp. NPDC048819 TaxID=3155268 RepID=UPI0033ED07B2
MRTVEWLATRLARLDRLDAIERAKECEVLAASGRALIGELAAVRRAALLEARNSGMTLTGIAAELDVSVQAISRAIKNDRGSGRSRPKEDDG